MNNTIKLSLIGGALLTGSAFAGKVASVPYVAAPSYASDVTVGYDSQYIFRGINKGDDLITAAVNTAWTCEYTGLDMNAGAWYGSVSDEDQNFDELDLTLGASKDLGFARANVGYIFYHYFDQPSGLENAQEVYFGLSKDLNYGVSTSLTYFWDVEEDNNGYTELALAKSFDIASKQLDLGVATGYLAEEGELSHVTAKLSHAIALTDTASLTPYIAHTWELDGLDSNGNTTSSWANQENEFFAGAALSVSF